jgi:hypothetical protein
MPPSPPLPLPWAPRRHDPFEMFNRQFGGGGFGGFGGGGGFGQRQQQQQQQQRAAAPLYDADSPVAALRQGKFPGHDAKHVWLVEFYAPCAPPRRRMRRRPTAP